MGRLTFVRLLWYHSQCSGKLDHGIPCDGELRSIEAPCSLSGFPFLIQKGLTLLYKYGETSDLVGLEATIGGKGGLIGQFDAGQGSIEIPDFL